VEFGAISLWDAGHYSDGLEACGRFMFKAAGLILRQTSKTQLHAVLLIAWCEPIPGAPNPTFPPQIPN
jgi:hypothetical protein